MIGGAVAAWAWGEPRATLDLDLVVNIPSPEDLIIYKLWYYSLSQQTRHVGNITSIVQTLGDALDDAYIEFWARKKGLTSIWEALLTKIRAQR